MKPGMGPVRDATKALASALAARMAPAPTVFARHDTQRVVLDMDAETATRLAKILEDKS